MMRRLLTAWQTLLEILFPPLCLNCRAYLQSLEEKENLLCRPCFAGIKIYSNLFRPVPSVNLMAVGSYEDTALKELLHYFKYNGFLAVKTPLERLIVQWLTINSHPALSVFTPQSGLIPIPLHKKRLRERGFNQAEIIAEILGKYLNLPVEKNLLERVRDTKPQIKMESGKKREENMRNSISIREGRGSSQYQNVILVDDIYTSGATMKEAMRVLRRAGVDNITAFVMAKT